MRLLFLFILMSIATVSFAQTGWETTTDAENGRKVYRGQFTFEDLKAEKTFDWLQKNADEYKPNIGAIKFLQKTLPDYTIVVVMGTWCSDSHDMIPRLYKVLQLTKYPMSKYSMYGVNRKKESLYAESALYKITNVPTIILYKSNIEVGRITETVRLSVETDLQDIIEKDK